MLTPMFTPMNQNVNMCVDLHCSENVLLLIGWNEYYNCVKEDAIDQCYFAPSHLPLPLPLLPLPPPPHPKKKN